MKKTMGLLISGFSVLTLSACQPPAKDDVKSKQTPAISNVSESVANCETQIRTKMDSQQIRFLSVKSLEREIEDSNKLLGTSTNTTYSFSKTGSEVNSLSISHELKNDMTFQSIDYSLNRADKESRFILNLEASASVKSSQSGFQLKQDLGVTKDCQFVALDTEANQATLKDASHVATLSKKYFADGNTEQENDVITFDPEIPFALFRTKLDDIKDLSSIPKLIKAQAYDKRLGIMMIEIKIDDDFQDFNEFNTVISMKSSNVLVTVGGKLLYKSKSYFTEDGKFTLTDYGNKKTWQVTKDIFDQQLLGSNAIGVKFKSELSADYITSKNQYEVVGMEKPEYPYFSGYAELTEERQEADGKTSFKYKKGTGIFKAQATEKDLLTNSTIDTKNSKIQEIAKSIRAKTSDRKQQIQEILTYLKNNYVFDNELILNNTLRPLTVAEALERGKGVCQHYSVIFITIARALGIPSTVVQGFYIGDGEPFGHAWVEAEIAQGTWQVLEPQSIQAMTDTNPILYFPIARNGVYEDPKANFSEVLFKYTKIDYTIRDVKP